MIDMSNPIGPTPLDRPGGLLGRPLDRVEAPFKVTGRATYAYEYRDFGQPAYGFVVVSSIGKGRITAIDTAAAEKAPGVLLVLTHANAPKQGTRSAETAPQLADDSVLFQGQPVALAVADTFEQARAAAYLIKPSYAAEPGSHDLEASRASAAVPKPRNGCSPDTNKGDVDAAFAAAPVKIDATYTTPPQAHAMMEPHATIARWDGDRLTLYTANQMLPRGIDTISATLLMLKDKIRLVSRYIGGGFGAKLQVQLDAILAAMAARMLNRPVKLALTRQQVFAATTHRSDTIQRLRLAADHDGALQAVAHESWSDNTPGQDDFEAAAMATRNIYATPALLTAHRLASLDLPTSASMRAPGEAVGLLALECAMDELALALGMDPIALRIKNEPATDPQNGKPFSTGDGIAADGAATPGNSRQAFNQQSYGAHFAEVGVSEVTAEIRLRRMLGVFTAGRILNAKTARSQAIGGMTFGVGAALMEAIVVDKRDGWFVNNNLAEYHVAAHADIPAIDAVFLPEADDRSSAMKSKGLGELGICGTGAAVANAVYNATGIRIRDYPITLDKVLRAWVQAERDQRSSAVPPLLPG
jgi:CO/xanthine dehydrogenase Mo-binding subunit